MATSYSEIAAQATALRHQAMGLLGGLDALLRTLQPLVEAEQGQGPKREPRRLLGSNQQEG